MKTDSINTIDYQQQFVEKLNSLKRQFKPFYQGEITAFASAPLHYRMRAEFKIWHENNDIFYAMYKPGEYKKPYTISDFPAGSTTINKLMPLLLEQLKPSELLRKKLFQVEFLSSTLGECIITLVYHKSLEKPWLEEAGRLATALGVSIIGRSRGQKLVVGQDWLSETLEIDGRQWIYTQYESAFTQPNAGINREMVQWAQDQSRQQSKNRDLLELYCGNGNFTLPLSTCFRKVFATEISKTSVKSACENITQNQVSNISLARLSSEEVAEAINGARRFRRLADAGVSLDDFDFSTVFVDPPRAGLDDASLKLVKQFDHILYISCNPDTLLQNIGQLSPTHRIEAFAFFDQFPYTHHCECGVKLQRIPA